MTYYMLSAHMTGESREPMTEEEQSQGFDRIAEVESAMRTAQALRFSGRLDEPRRSRVVRPSTRGRITDGPYIETKEWLGGFYVIEAADLGAALDWASRVSEAINAPIEVRPFVGVAEA